MDEKKQYEQQQYEENQYEDKLYNLKNELKRIKKEQKNNRIKKYIELFDDAVNKHFDFYLNKNLGNNNVTFNINNETLDYNNETLDYNNIDDINKYYSYINMLFLEKIPNSVKKYNDEESYNYKKIRFSKIIKNSKKYNLNNNLKEFEEIFSNIYQRILGKNIKELYSENELKKQYYKRYSLYKYIENYEKYIYNVYKYIKDDKYKDMSIKNENIKNIINKISTEILDIGELLEKEKLKRNEFDEMYTNVIEFYDYISQNDFLLNCNIILDFILYGEDYIKNKYFTKDKDGDVLSVI